MPFYTFKCRTCELEEDFLREMGDFKEPLCEVCAYNPEAQGKYERMKKVVSKNVGANFCGPGFHSNDYGRPEGRFSSMESVGGKYNQRIERLPSETASVNEIIDSQPKDTLKKLPKEKQRKKKKD